MRHFISQATIELVKSRWMIRMLWGFARPVLRSRGIRSLTTSPAFVTLRKRHRALPVRGKGLSHLISDVFFWSNLSSARIADAGD